MNILDLELMLSCVEIWGNVAILCTWTRGCTMVGRIMTPSKKSRSSSLAPVNILCDMAKGN